MAIIKLNNLTFFYPEKENATLNNISLSINMGEFVVLCGKSGSGKTTLLRLLKPELSPKGKIEGSVSLFDNSVFELDSRESALKIGFVQQNVDYQIVTHSVRSELAFGLENINLDSNEITSRIAEVAGLFSLNEILDERVTELSSGQKQLLCLASICAMHPEIIILDEPFSQLDPVSAEKILNALKKLNEEFSVTIIISEHRLENLIPIADRVIAIEDGKILYNDNPKNLSKELNKNSQFLYYSVPVQIRLFSNFGINDTPLTISEGRKKLQELVPDPKIKKFEYNQKINSNELALKVKHLYFAYNKSGYVLKDFSLEVKKCSVFALMGENGSGKTTALKLITGLLESKRGRIEFYGSNKSRRFSVLPQKCESLFAGPTIYDDLHSSLNSLKISKEEKKKLIMEQAEFFEICGVLNSHPYDVSGGEMQRSALTMVMLSNPEILFLDEPTKGMDNLFKIQLGGKLKELAKSGVTVFMVCHDNEFCATYADECAFLFDGRIISKSDSNTFFSKNYYYTTAASKLSRGIFENTITEEQVEELCRKNL